MFGFKKGVIASAGAYTSEVTQFIALLKERDPTLEGRQLAGRKLLWDKAPINLDERAEQKQDRVDQSGYVYYRDYGDLPRD